MNLKTTVLIDTLIEAVLAFSTLSLAVVMPQVFHYFGLGKEFLPMYFPIMVLGFLSVRRWVGIIPALSAPLLSSLMTGMPALPVAAAVSAELAFLFLSVRFALNRKWNLIAVLPFVLVIGRTFSFLGQMIMNGGHADRAWAFSSAGYPGLAALFVLGTVLFLFGAGKSLNEK